MRKSKLRKDLEIGSKYGNLIILENIYEGGNGGAKIKVQCKCGKIYITGKANVKRGSVTQCKNCYTGFPKLKARRGVGEMSGQHWCNIIKNAECRDWKVLLTKEEAYNLYLKQNKKCALSNIPIQFDNYKTQEKTASLDRKDSSLDYTLNNVQWVHKAVNRMKQNFTQERFLELCKLINLNDEKRISNYRI